MTTEERILFLEKEIKRLKKRNSFFSISIPITIFILFSISTLPVISQNVPDLITARQLKIVDNNGKTRIEFGIGSSNNTIARFSDENANPRIILGIAEESADIFLIGEKLHPAISFNVNKCEPSIRLIDQNRKQRVFLTINETGSPSLNLIDKNNSPRIALRVSEEQGASGILLSDENENMRITLLESLKGTGLIFFDKNGKVIWSIPK